MTVGNGVSDWARYGVSVTGSATVSLTASLTGSPTVPVSDGVNEGFGDDVRDGVSDGASDDVSDGVGIGVDVRISFGAFCRGEIEGGRSIEENWGIYRSWKAGMSREEGTAAVKGVQWRGVAWSVMVGDGNEYFFELCRAVVYYDGGFDAYDHWGCFWGGGTLFFSQSRGWKCSCEEPKNT